MTPAPRSRARPEGTAQGVLPAYPQVASTYTPQYGYYPLAPWAGLAVLCAWTAAALALAAFLLRRRDA
jgi:ABC-type transport system involved in multi-copper enzyme maturation permease subunit